MELKLKPQSTIELWSIFTDDNERVNDLWIQINQVNETKYQMVDMEYKYLSKNSVNWEYVVIGDGMSLTPKPLKNVIDDFWILLVNYVKNNPYKNLEICGKITNTYGENNNSNFEHIYKLKFKESNMILETISATDYNPQFNKKPINFGKMIDDLKISKCQLEDLPKHIAKYQEIFIKQVPDYFKFIKTLKSLK